jgi:hypothetical protein
MALAEGAEQDDVRVLGKEVERRVRVVVRLVLDVGLVEDDRGA